MIARTVCLILGLTLTSTAAAQTSCRELRARGFTIRRIEIVDSANVALGPFGRGTHRIVWADSVARLLAAEYRDERQLTGVLVVLSAAAGSFFLYETRAGKGLWSAPANRWLSIALPLNLVMLKVHRNAQESLRKAIRFHNQSC